MRRDVEVEKGVLLAERTRFWVWSTAVREAVRRAGETSVRHRVEATERSRVSGNRQWRVEPVECACSMTPEHMWLSAASCGYGSGYEPGSQWEWNPDCPQHRPSSVTLGYPIPAVPGA